MERLYVKCHPLAEITGEFVSRTLRVSKQVLGGLVGRGPQTRYGEPKCASVGRFDLLAAIAAVELLVGAHTPTIAAQLYVYNGGKADIGMRFIG